jgi:hypothetical protein
VRRSLKIWQFELLGYLFRPGEGKRSELYGLSFLPAASPEAPRLVDSQKIRGLVLPDSE